ncbi:MAG: FecR domain-containing protein [Dechloromonas sp.]|nr:MAG: FecR domain-containing protein [Dechloromonas sp.]
MNRRKLLKDLGALTLTIGPGFWPAAKAAGMLLPPPGFYRLRGKVLINGQPARQGMPVGPGDTVTTGSDGEAIYVIGKDVYLQRDRSIVSINGDAIKSGLRVISGKLLSVFAKGQRQIAVPTATIGIRGTACYIEATTDRTYFCLCYGTADIAAAGDPARSASITTRYHDSPFYLGNGNSFLEPAPVINHSDAELILLESLVGRIPPFQEFPGNITGRY